MMAPPMIVTEDTPPDMLAGSMDLTVVLPGDHSLKMSVERSTPMMDLLVQVTTANKMSPAGYIIKPLNERGTLPYKPSTPIGALDAWTIQVVPKQHAQCTNVKRSMNSLNQPFEQTFRLQVHLPRNQLFVARVSPKTRLADILYQVCTEKNLDPVKYSLRHPCNLDQVLSLSCSLAEYKLQELTLVCNRTHPVEVSTVDIMSLQRDSANPAYRNTLCEGSVSSGSLEGRSLSPVPSDESSASPPPLSLPPSRPTRKRRPAPKPPAVIKKPVNEEKQRNGCQTSAVINHSRNSSDSSGYHEASVLSESPQSNSVPESLCQRKMASVSEVPTLSQSMTDVSVIEPRMQQATSYNSINSASSGTGRKKKCAPPPPPVEKHRAQSMTEDQQRTPSVSSTASSTTTLDGNEMNVAVKSATLPPSSRLNTEPPRARLPSPTITSLSHSPTPAPATAHALTSKVVIQALTPASAPTPAPTTPQVPPAPRPRSVVGVPVSGRYRPSPKKSPAPRPRPRTLVSTSKTDINSTDELEPQSGGQHSRRNSSFMNKDMPNSIFNSHKACIGEMICKFDSKDSEDPNQPSVADQEIRQFGNKINEILENCQSDNVSFEKGMSYGALSLTETERGDSQPDRHESLVAMDSPQVVGANSEIDLRGADIRMADEEIDRIFSNAVESCTADTEESECTLSLPPPLDGECEQESGKWEGERTQDETLDWEYRLPAPPTFRDHAHSPTLTEYDTLTIGNLTDVLHNSADADLVKSEERITNSCPVLKPSEIKVNNVKTSNDDYKENLLPKEKKVIGNNKLIPFGDQESISVNAHIEQDVVNELTSTLQRISSKVDLDYVENKPLVSTSTLENFQITTYKDTKPLEVFEDDSIKSSAGEKRDKSKDDAVFRAPKARVKEPHLSRTSSFSLESKLSGPVIKRSVSYVSLLAANMPRNSQPYRAHLVQQPPSYTDSDSLPWSATTLASLRKTTSELNIDNISQYDGKRMKEENNWQTSHDSTGLQSVQVLRKILSRSHANLSTSLEEPDVPSQRDQFITENSYEETLDGYIDNRNLKRSQSQENVSPIKISLSNKMEHSELLDRDLKSCTDNLIRPPSINLSTWSERPKRQVLIKNDCDYTFGTSKNCSGEDDRTTGQTTIDESECDKDNNQTGFISRTEFASKKNGTLKMEGRSKSIGDLSRIPIVTAVELKKPYTLHNFDQTALRPVKTVEDEDKFSQAQPNYPEDANSFIGVNSLAKRFGVPNKRPTSVYVMSQTKNNFETEVQNTNKTSKSTFGENTVKQENKMGQSKELLERFREAQKTNGHHTIHDPTSEIKALAKISSGGFIGNPIVSASNLSCNTLIKEENLNEVDSKTVNFTRNMNSSNIPVATTNSTSTNFTERSAASGVVLRKTQTLDRIPRPISLQPVVKGFKIPSQIYVTNSSKDSTTLILPKTKEVVPNKDSDYSNSEFSDQRTTYRRVSSTPSSTDIKETAKESSVVKRFSRARSEWSCIAKQDASVPPPPPPLLLPALKPVGERKGVRLLPPPEADPRDQLMDSIRSFKKDYLKTVSK